ncbi:MAG: hypothetical protein KBT66_14380, partial [Amphritea sp.]|nr:hypothetical protein [Amphritea sp.]
MTKHEMSDSELGNISDRLHQDYIQQAVDTPSTLDNVVLKEALSIAAKLKAKHAHKSVNFDEFLVLAAADKPSSNARNRTSETGAYILDIKEDSDDPNLGIIIFNVHPDHLEKNLGRHIEVTLGGVVVLSGKISGEELIADICFSELDMS